MRAVDRDVARQERELTKQKADLAKAIEAEALAKSAFDAQGDDKALDAASKARITKERHERLVTSAESALASAQAAKAAQDRLDLAAQLEADRATLAAWTARCEPFIGAIIAADVEIDSAVLGAACVVAELSTVYARACDAANALGERVKDIPRPDLAEVRLETRRRLRDARVGREDLSQSWMASARDDWRTRDMTASELASYEAGSARARQEEAEIERQRGLQVAATMAAEQAKAGEK
jgi:hypothetical protein